VETLSNEDIESVSEDVYNDCIEEKEAVLQNLVRVSL
jgi:hypothetical protein